MESRTNHTSDSPTKLPFKLLEEITNNFAEERLLGRGAFGKVYKGVHADGEEIAVKILPFIQGTDNEQFQNEFENLKRLKHKNIVRLVGFCDETEEIVATYKGKKVLCDIIHRALCLEYVPNGSLGKHLSSEQLGKNWPIRYKIIKGICEGLKYLHEGSDVPILHFDLKPENILLDEKMEPKIADFGLSRLIGQENTIRTLSPLGTLGYLPPEFINNQVISKEFDIFSLGVIIAKVITGIMKYSSIADMDAPEFIEHVHDNWRRSLQETPSCSSLQADCEQVKGCIEIAINCMNKDRHKRPPIKDIVSKLDAMENRQTDSQCYTEKVCTEEESIDIFKFNMSARPSPDLATHSSKIRCLQACPEVASFTRIEQVPTSDNRSSNSGINEEAAGSNAAAAAAAREYHKREHRVYTHLAHALQSPYTSKDCIAMCVGASSTDYFPGESIENTLEPGDIDEHQRPSYWSSGGQEDPSVPECLIYKLCSDLCLIDEIRVRPFRAFFQRGRPIFSAQYVRFRFGCPKTPLQPDDLVSDENEGKLTADNNFIWTYTSPEFQMRMVNSLQSFKLPRPVLCIGGVVKIELLGRIQKQRSDDLYYICVSHVQILGNPLSPEFGAAPCDNGMILKYCPDPDRSTWRDLANPLSSEFGAAPCDNGLILKYCPDPDRSKWRNLAARFWHRVTGHRI